MKKKNNKYSFVFDNVSHNWFVIGTNSDKYKFYGRITKNKKVKEWLDDKEKSQV